MSNFVFKRTIATNLKFAGIIDTDSMKKNSPILLSLINTNRRWGGHYS